MCALVHPAFTIRVYGMPYRFSLYFRLLTLSGREGPTFIAEVFGVPISKDDLLTLHSAQWGPVGARDE